jgi:uracil-DNA glycosylase
MICSGPKPARIMIVGEAPGYNEIEKGLPFVGAAGYELTKMLQEAGINRQECFITNVTSERPLDNEIESFFVKKQEAQAKGIPLFMGRYPLSPITNGLKELFNVIPQVAPKLIIAAGSTPLWALTGLFGIKKWRGSELESQWNCPLVPIYHPAAIMRDWTLRNISIHDLRRAKRVLDQGGIIKPKWNFKVRPRFADLHEFFVRWSRAEKVTCDIETRGGQIACVGIGTSQHDALCVPLMSVADPNGYWSENEEQMIVQMLRKFLRERKVIFQNGAYDLQYFAKQMGFVPSISDDTMIMQHTLFPELLKALDFQASMYCEYYRFWKDDGKKWDSSMPEDDLWRYNCEDCVRTFECYEALNDLVDRMQMREQYTFQMGVFQETFKMMLRGIRVDKAKKSEVGVELGKLLDARMEWIETVLGHPFNPRSPKKMQELFYNDFRIKPIRSRKTGRPTLDDAALKSIAKKNHLLRPLVECIEEVRSIGVFKSTFAEAELSDDGRMRCSINITGADTLRFSTSEDAFGTGTNLQNLPKGTEDE